MANFKTKVKNAFLKVEEVVTDHGGTILFGLGALFVSGMVKSYDKTLTNYQKQANEDYRGFLDKVLDKTGSQEEVERIDAEITEAAHEVAEGK